MVQVEKLVQQVDQEVEVQELLLVQVVQEHQIKDLQEVQQKEVEIIELVEVEVQPKLVIVMVKVQGEMV
jgi:hypothetical protein